jgi:hypothetical protein
VTAHTHATPEPGCYRCDIGADEAAHAALAAGYRVRVVVELRHDDRATSLTGATFTHDRGELGPAVLGLLGAMLPRLLDKLDGGPDA